jgi:hypothetical protein
MKKPDVVFRALGQLFEFQREITKFKLQPKQANAGDSALNRPPAAARRLKTKETGRSA